MSATRNGIDTHSHWLPASYAEHVRRQAETDCEFARLNGPLVRLIADPDSKLRRIELRVEEMDACGLAVSAVSLPPPAATFGSPSLRREIAREGNDELLTACAAHAGRLVGLVTLPLPCVDDALEELERVAAHPLARGISLLTTCEEFTLDDPALEPLWKRVAELSLPVQTHPALDCLQTAMEPWMLPATLAPVMSSSLGVARMVLSGLLDRVPGLDLIVPHLGGALPYLAQRFDDFGKGDARHPFAYYLRNRLYVDTCSFHPPALRCAVETVGVERIVLGSDYPFRGALRRLVDDVAASVPGERERELIISENASRWFAA